MAQLSYNTTQYSKNTNFIKPMLIVLAFIATFAAGYAAPGIRTLLAQRPAQTLGKQVAADVLAGNLDTIIEKGDVNFKASYEDAESLKIGLGDVKAENAQVLGVTSGGDSEYYTYSQEVDGLAERTHPTTGEKTTAATIDVTMVREGGKWKVFDIVVE